MAAQTDGQGDIDMDGKSADEKIDENLYSRQLYVLDHESMQKVTQNNVLIIGMNGLGAEIAKNVILAGVKSVSILDNTKVCINDLSSHFYLSPSDVGKERAASCVSKLQDLNRYVKVSCINEKLSDKLIESKAYQVVVMVGYPLKSQIEYNNLCHKHGIKFISTEACGVFGSIFVDFGDKFEIRDVNGEPRRQGIVRLITNDKKGVVSVHDDSRHGMVDGDLVIFDEIDGMTELNNRDPIKIIDKGNYQFEIDCDTSKFAKYAGNGMYYQVKQPKTVSFDTLEKLIENPAPTKFVPSDYVNNPMLQHIFYRALNDFRSKHSRFPAPTSADDAGKVVEFAEAIVKSLSGKDKDNKNGPKIEIPKNKFLSLARCSGAVINPMAATLGGIVGQEVLKACSGKFTPIQQLFYIDSFESLPPVFADKNESKIDVANEFAAQNSRYDDNIAVFGKTIQQSMFETNIFLVGAGAIGCEMLKNWSLMGVACQSDKSGKSKKGVIYVTDMDSIEKSNLNRQFLFRDKDVGKMKSSTAAANVSKMNPDINIIAQENRVGTDSENVYNDEFWFSLDIVCTALDNVDARLYVDGQCIKYNKPMLESGTLGTKGNTQIIIPKMTESYGSSRDPPEKSFPICTLHNFPNKIEHTIAWARDKFEGSFTKIPQDCNDYLNNKDYLTELAKDTTAELDTLKELNSSLKDEKPLTFKDCVSWIRNKFEHDYTYQINQLLHNFPKDAKTNDGAPFWSGPKRAPNSLKFDENDLLHMSYIIAGANLRAHIYDIKNATSDIKKVQEILSSIKVKEYKIRKVKIAANDAEAEQMKNEFKIEDYDEQVAKLRASLPKPDTLAGYKLNVHSFEKDDDSNFHMDFICACANLRARNYRIKEGTRHEIKGIAGKIIPAIATTTSLVTGLVSLEFYKILQSNFKKIEHFRNCFVNLAICQFAMSEPVPTPASSVMKKGKEWHFTLWDKIEIKGQKDMTCQQLIDYFEKEWNMEVNMLSYGNTILYAFYMNGKKQKARKAAKLKKLAKAANPNGLSKDKKFVEFEVSCSYLDDDDNANDDDDEDPELPTIRLYLS